MDQEPSLARAKPNEDYNKQFLRLSICQWTRDLSPQTERTTRTTEFTNILLKRRWNKVYNEMLNALGYFATRFAGFTQGLTELLVKSISELVEFNENYAAPAMPRNDPSQDLLKNYFQDGVTYYVRIRGVPENNRQPH
ncbi:hypothetical protein GGR51DRAFT_557100 [Nemania sp. FL0031]|nr:hypothetical protein GGR51DRAFT_557100 [Nemania sp. FL0031]